jgi:hypothetical protein
MPKPGNKIRIPLPEKKALELLLKVKPTAEMPRQGIPPQKPTGKHERK